MAHDMLSWKIAIYTQHCRTVSEIKPRLRVLLYMSRAITVACVHWDSSNQIFEWLSYLRRQTTRIVSARVLFLSGLPVKQVANISLIGYQLYRPPIITILCFRFQALSLSTKIISYIGDCDWSLFFYSFSITSP